MNNGQRVTAVACLLGVGLLPAVGHSDELASRASLAELNAIGQVVIAVSASAGGDESVLRQLIELRLQTAGIALDPNVETRLVANVELVRDTSAAGERHFSYRISLSFQELVRTVRTPRTTFYATTWSGNASVTSFNTPAHFETVVDQLDAKMNSFLSTVAADTKAASRSSDNR